MKKILSILVLSIGFFGGSQLLDKPVQTGGIVPLKGSPIAESDKNHRTVAQEGDIVFKYSYQGKPLKLTLRGLDWSEALKKASFKCMDYYTDGKMASVGEEIYLDLIDICVNPREEKSQN